MATTDTGQEGGMQSVLEGIRVIDFARFIAGPSCAALLGDLGAQVIRVERPNGGDDRWVGPIGENGEGALFIQNNRNKLSITIDLRTEEGLGIVDRLVQSADVVVMNMPENVLKSMKLDYERLSALNPRLIYTSVSAFGRTGPYSQKLGFDAVGQLMSGAASRTGMPDQPVRTPVQYVDWGTGMAATIGTLAALMHRDKTGKGQRVEAALLPTALMMASSMIVEQGVTQCNREASLNRGQMSAPNDIFAVKDGWILIQVVGQSLFKRWLNLVGKPEWLEDPRFATDKLRGKNWQVINEQMNEWCAGRTREEVLADLEQARVPAYPLYTVQDAIDDPHVQETGALQPVEYPGLARPAPMVRTPIQLSDAPLTAPARPPLLGEHTDAMLAELGYDQQAIDTLRTEGVI